MRSLLSIIAGVLVTLMVTSWCLWQHPRDNAPVIGLSLPRTIDPCMCSTSDELRLLGAIFEPLVRLNPLNLKLLPGLAKSWSSNDTHTTWTFNIDERAKWRDGKPVTAHDIRRGLLRHLIAQSPNAFYLDGLVRGAFTDAADIDERRKYLEANCEIRCPDDHTLVLNLVHSAPYMASILSLPVFVPLTEAHDAETDAARLSWTDWININGNGPMHVTVYIPRHRYRFEPNPMYGGYNTAKGPVEVAVIDDVGSAIRQFFSGQVDAIFQLPAEVVGDLRRNKVDALQQSQSLGTAFWRVRMEPRPNADPKETAVLTDPRMRQALARSIDRNAICENILQGNAKPATTFVPTELDKYLPYHAPTDVLAYDPEGAAADIEALRKEYGELPVLEMVAPSQPAERLSIAEFISDQWRRKLGVKVQLSVVQRTELKTRENTREYEFCYDTWLGDFLDPITFLDCFRTNAGANRTGYADPTYDGLLDRATVSLGDERWKLLESAERRLMEQTPLIPLFHVTCSFLVRPGLEGAVTSPLETVHLCQLGWSKDAKK